MRTRFTGLLVALGVAAGPLKAQSTIVAGDGFDLGMTGYVGSLAAAQELGYDAPSIERRSAFVDNLLRVKWLATIGETVRISVHNRLQTQYTTTAAATGSSALGIGVSAVPGRPVDLSSSVTVSDHVRVRHDIDRLSVNILSDVVDLTIGRQGISWGISNLFPVADVWAQFSPYELDTEEKPGIDAVRGLIYPAENWELDVVVAARGSARDFSAGARATVQLSGADLYFGGGKLWRQVMGMAGLSLVLENWALRGEVVVPWDLDRDAFRRIRATLGADYYSADLFLSLEYHHNGLGAADQSGYLGVLASPEFRRGETYYLGRDYAGALVSYRINDRLSLAASNLLNLADGSGSISPTVSYDLGQQWRLNGGTLLTFGAAPSFMPVPAINSEFRSYGNLAFLQLSVYF